MSAREHILPPATTYLERVWDETLPAWEPLAEALRTPSEGVSPAFAPWYAAEYGLAEFAPYFQTVQQLMDAGLPWLFTRGTAAGVAAALGWVGFAGVRVEEVGARLHIDICRIATAEEISRIAHVVRASVPAHVQFWRVYHVHDRRTLRLDGGQPLDKAMLDDDSGIWISVATGEPVKASFGQVHRGGVETLAAGQPLAWALAELIGRVSRNDKAVLDSWRLDSRLLATEFGGLGELLRREVPQYQSPPTEGGMPGVTTITLAAWPAPSVQTAQKQTTAQELPAVIPLPESWTGNWDTRTWLPINIESRQTESI